MISRRRLVCAVAVSGFLLFAYPVAGQTRPGTALSPTPSTGAGPEYIPDAPYRATFWRDGDPGERLVLRGRVVDTTGQPLTGAVVDVWQADGGGQYHANAYRGKVKTDPSGRYAFRTALPGNRFGAKHIHMMVTHETHESVTARIVFKGDPNLTQGGRGTAIVLEETKVKGELVYVGNFDVVMQRQ